MGPYRIIYVYVYMSGTSIINQKTVLYSNFLAIDSAVPWESSCPYGVLPTNHRAAALRSARVAQREAEPISQSRRDICWPGSAGEFDQLTV